MDGLSLSVVGDTYRVVITGEQTGGAFAVIDMLVPPGGGPGPHSHAGMQESFYVLAGEIAVRTKRQSYTAKPGSFVSIPLGGVVHSFKNTAANPAHLLCVVVPAGLEALFKEIGQSVPAGTFLPARPLGPAELKQLTQIAEKHGQKLFPPDYLD
jgi:quercetin dioxygenase-like cupin family protein